MDLHHRHSDYDPDALLPELFCQYYYYINIKRKNQIIYI